MTAHPAPAATTSPIRKLHDAGVSVWLDDLSRPLLEDGVLEEYVTTHGVSGVTCNPTIFARALRASDRYDGDVRALADAGVRDPREAYFRLALGDVEQAAALLSHTYTASD